MVTEYDFDHTDWKVSRNIADSLVDSVAEGSTFLQT